MTYAYRGSKIFELQNPQYADCSPPKIKRSDHRMKRFFSTWDARAWHMLEVVRYRHLYELTTGSQTCLMGDVSHQFVPLEDLINIITADKDARIAELEEQLKNNKNSNKKDKKSKDLENKSKKQKDSSSPKALPHFNKLRHEDIEPLSKMKRKDEEPSSKTKDKDREQFSKTKDNDRELLTDSSNDDEKPSAKLKGGLRREDVDSIGRLRDEDVESMAKAPEEEINARKILRRAMNKLENIDEIVNENKKLHSWLRVSQERIKNLEDKKKRLESELAELRSKSQIQMDLDKAQEMLAKVGELPPEGNTEEIDEAEIQSLSNERDELQEKVRLLEEELEQSKKKEQEIEMLKKQSESDSYSLEEMARENETYKKKLDSMKCLETQIQELKKHGIALANKYKKESQKTAEQLKRMSNTIKELDKLKDERDYLLKKVDELGRHEDQYKALQQKLQKVDCIIKENEMLNNKLQALDKLEAENQYLRCRLEEVQAIEMSAAEDKERIAQLQEAVADQEEEMKDLLCQIEKLTNGRTEEEVERLKCELYETSSKLKLCEEQLAEIPLLEAEIDDLRKKLQLCCQAFAEQKTGENLSRQIEVRLPCQSTSIAADYKNQIPKQAILGKRKEEIIELPDKPINCREILLKQEKLFESIGKMDANEMKEVMSCEEVQDLLQSSKNIITCVLEDMIEHQKEMEELEKYNAAMKSEIESLKANMGPNNFNELLAEVSTLKKILEEKDLEINKLKTQSRQFALLSKTLAKDTAAGSFVLPETSMSDTNILEIKTLQDLNNQLKVELQAANEGLKSVVNLEKMLELEHNARCKAEKKLKECREGKQFGENSDQYECCKALQEEINDFKLQTTELNKLINELKKENELLRDLQKPCPDFSKELEEKCALENLLSLLQAELDAFKGQKLGEECEALRNELKRVLEQNCELKALIQCYRQRLDLEKAAQQLAELEAKKPKEHELEEAEVLSIEALGKEQPEQIVPILQPVEPSPEKKEEVEVPIEKEKEKILIEKEEEKVPKEKEKIPIEKEEEKVPKEKEEIPTEKEEKLPTEKEEEKEEKLPTEKEEEKEKEEKLPTVKEEEKEEKLPTEKEKEKEEKLPTEKGEEKEEKEPLKEEIQETKSKESSKESSIEMDAAKKELETDALEEKEKEPSVVETESEEKTLQEISSEIKSEEKEKPLLRMEEATLEKDEEEKIESDKKTDAKDIEAPSETKTSETNLGEDTLVDEKLSKKKDSQTEAKTTPSKGILKSEKVEESTSKKDSETVEEKSLTKKTDSLSDSTLKESIAKSEYERVSKDKVTLEDKKKQKSVSLVENLSKTDKKIDSSNKTGSKLDLSSKTDITKKDETKSSSVDLKKKDKDNIKRLESERQLSQIRSQVSKMKVEDKFQPKISPSGRWTTGPRQGMPAAGLDKDAEIGRLQDIITEKDLLIKELEKNLNNTTNERDTLRGNANKLNDENNKLKTRAETAEAKLRTKRDIPESQIKQSVESEADAEKLKEKLKQLEKECEDKLKKLSEQHKKELMARDKKYNDNLNAMKAGYETDIRKLTERHKMSIMRLQSLHEDEVQELNNNYETQMEAMQTQSEKAMDEIAKGSAMKVNQLAKKHAKKLKESETKFKKDLKEKEEKYLETIDDLQKNLHDSLEELESQKKKVEDYGSKIQAQLSRDSLKFRKSSAKKLSMMKDKYEEMLKDQREKYETQIESLKQALKDKEAEGVCECAYAKKKTLRKESKSSLDFNEVLQKILEEGLESLSFNEIALVHRKACYALQNIVLNSEISPVLDPPIGDPCPHTPLMQAEKEQLLQRIYALENEITEKQKQTQDAIVNMEAAVKKERFRLLELRNLLQSEQMKNSELTLLLSSQTKLQSDLKEERDRLEDQATLQKSLCLEKTKELNQEKEDKKFLQNELERLRTTVQKLCSALDIERQNLKFAQKKGMDLVQSMQEQLEMYSNKENRLAIQLENEVKYRQELQCQLQAIQQSFYHMVNLPDVEKKSSQLSGPVESKSEKEKQNLDQIREKKYKIKYNSGKKSKK